MPYSQKASSGVGFERAHARKQGSRKKRKAQAVNRGAERNRKGAIMIEVINESNFDEKVLQAKGLVMVELFATWCPHCQRMAPVVDELATMVAGQATVYRVDVDASPDLANKYAPNGFPTFAMFRDGRLVKEQTGEQSLDALLNLVAAS